MTSTDERIINSVQVNLISILKVIFLNKHNWTNIFTFVSCNYVGKWFNFGFLMTSSLTKGSIFNIIFCQICMINTKTLLLINSKNQLINSKRVIFCCDLVTMNFIFAELLSHNQSRVECVWSWTCFINFVAISLLNWFVAKRLIQIICRWCSSLTS